MKTSDEKLFAQLDPELARVLFPDRFEGDSIVTLVYPQLDGELASRAKPVVERAAEHEVVTDPTRPGAPFVCHTSFTLDQLEDLHSLYSLLEDEIERVLIDGRRLPLLIELWLPLLWSLRA